MASKDPDFFVFLLLLWPITAGFCLSRRVTNPDRLGAMGFVVVSTTLAGLCLEQNAALPIAMGVLIVPLLLIVLSLRRSFRS